MNKLVSYLAVSIAIGGVFAHTVQAAEKKVLLKTPIAFGTGLPGLGTTIKWVSETADDVSGGTLKVKLYAPGKLVAAFEILDAVSTGKVHAGFATSGFWAGKIPASVIFSSTPFGPEAGEFLAWVYFGNGRKLWQKMYDDNKFNVHVIPCGIIAPETSGWFKKPINGPEDLKGLNMRFFGLGGKVMQSLGVSTSTLPGGEVFPALEKGAIDAAEFSMPAIDKKLGLYKVAKYNYFPGWHQQSTLLELLVNKNTWGKLSKTHKSILEVSCKAAMTQALAEGEAIQFDAMTENVEKNGVHIKTWSPEMLKLFKSTWGNVIDKEISSNAQFKTIWADFTSFRSKYKIWKDNAFLPRN